MAYRRRRYGKVRGIRAIRAKRAARRTYRKAIRMPKRIVVKKFANTVGQIVARSGRSRPSHGGRRFGRRIRRRY